VNDNLQSVFVVKRVSRQLQLCHFQMSLCSVGQIINKLHTHCAISFTEISDVCCSNMSDQMLFVFRYSGQYVAAYIFSLC